MRREIKGIVLAAGSGTRIRHFTGDMLNKCVLELNGKPLVAYPVESLQAVGIRDPIVIVKHAQESVEKALSAYKVQFIPQSDQKGTAKAVESGLDAIVQVGNVPKDVFVLYGDSSAFFDEKLLLDMLLHHNIDKATITLLSVIVDDPTGLGRIIRNSSGEIVAVREEKDATDDERKITEINTGAAIYNFKMLQRLLQRVKPNAKNNEYYLTDVISLAINGNLRVIAYRSNDNRVGIGINTQEQHEEAQRVMKERKPKRS